VEVNRKFARLLVHLVLPNAAVLANALEFHWQAGPLNAVATCAVQEAAVNKVEVEAVSTKLMFKFLEALIGL